MSSNTFAGCTTVLDSLDAPALDDLEPLRAVVGDARVVGLGEGAHFVREFSLARARLIRYLVERCAFTVVAIEMGDTEAAAVNPWLAGDGEEDDLPGALGPHSVSLFGELLHWLRRYNRGRTRQPIQLIGIDLPNTLTLRPDLDPVADYLRAVDDGVAEDVLRTAAEIDVARRRLDAACHTDYMLRAMSNLFAGTGLPDDTSIRDHCMATCVQWHLDRLDADARVVLVAHNNHVQKTPVTYEGHPAALPMGQYLARDLGPRYRAVGMTHTASHVPEMSWPAEGSPVGFTVETVRLDDPPPGSVERALADAGLDKHFTLTDIRSSTTPLKSIRSQSATMDLDVPEAFDAILSTPTANH